MANPGSRPRRWADPLNPRPHLNPRAAGNASTPLAAQAASGQKRNQKIERNRKIASPPIPKTPPCIKLKSVMIAKTPEHAVDRERLWSRPCQGNDDKSRSLGRITKPWIARDKFSLSGPLLTPCESRPSMQHHDRRMRPHPRRLMLLHLDRNRPAPIARHRKRDAFSVATHREGHEKKHCLCLPVGSA